MRNHDPNYGDNTICDVCHDVFDVRRTPHEVIDDKWWVCDSCVEYYDEEELREQIIENQSWREKSRNFVGGR
tara:strand:+ start:477 stop:692 length:216 start_codon:yes stop_codon:yes gene_type:complete